MKRLIYFLTTALVALTTTTSCGDMDENYRQYLEDIPTYSPAVRNLTAASLETGSLTLRWEIVDETNLIRSVRILVKKTATDIDTIDIPRVVTEYTVTGLDPQGYDFSVYTLDGYGNLSIPVTRTFTPIPGRE